MTRAEYSAAEAFERNLGLIDRGEQQALLGKRVALAGCGGVGGVHAHTLARLGVGRFRVADPDRFSLVNFNRQIGATIHTVGRGKARVTAEMILAINPQAEVDVVDAPLSGANLAAFLHDVDLVVDGIDFFELPARRALLSAAEARGIPVLIAAPLGFSATLHVFGPGAMSFDDYFDLHDGQSALDQYTRFLLGLAPAALHAPYTDLSSADPAQGRGPSSIIGSQLAACVAGAEALRILLGRAPSRCAPEYLQIDVYRRRMVARRVAGGLRHPVQRLRLWLLARHLRRCGLDAALAALAPA